MIGTAPEGGPLTPGQTRLWFLHQLLPDDTAYAMVTALRLRGPLDLAALRAALADVTRRHPALRTTFAVDPSGQGPLAKVSAHPPPTDLVDLGGLPVEQGHELVRQHLERSGMSAVELERGPISRWTLMRVRADDHFLVLRTHHIVVDGGSLPALCASLEHAYDQRRRGRPVVGGSPEEVEEWAHEEDLPADSLDHWREVLAAAPAQPLVLPALRERGEQQAAIASTAPLVNGRCVVADSELVRLRHLAADEGCTTQLVLLAALICLLHRYSQQEDVIVGTPVDMRAGAADRQRVGLYVNVLPIRVHLGAGALSFREALRRTRHAWLEAHEHRRVPFERLVTEFHQDATATLHPFFTALFAYQQAPPVPRLAGLDVSSVPVVPSAAKYELTVTATEDARQVSVDVDVDGRTADQAEADATARALRALLAGATEDPGCAVADLPMLDGAGRRALGGYWPSAQRVAHAVANSADLWRPAHRSFEAQVRRCPDAVAVVHGAHSITYAVLNARANRLARELVERGVGPEQVVGVCVGRGPMLIVVLLAVLKAGAAYLPLDPSYPPRRLRDMIEDAGMGLLVAEPELLARTGLTGLPEVHLLHEREDRVEARPAHDLTGPGAEVHPQSLAYVLFTSGSTGRPKGVALQHGNLDTFLRWAGRAFTEEELSRVIATTSVSFDVSIFEIFAPLAHGGTVVLGESSVEVPTMPAAAGASLLSTVPTAVDALAAADAIPRSVRTVNIGGETLQRGVVRRLSRRVPGVRVHNLYGPSETTTHSADARVPLDTDAAPTIGRPMPTVLMWVADRGSRPVPVGVVGEIVIGGAGLARGYVGRPRLTAERFAPDPASGTDGGRLYLTGDRARVDGQGELVFHGRGDGQVKLRGVRIEVEEIETVIRAHAEVLDAAVVVVHRDGLPHHLVAFAMVGGGLPDDTDRLRQDLLAYLRARMPRTMMPAELALREHLPQTANGKLDRAELLRQLDCTPARGPAEVPVRAEPRTEIERRIAAIWCEVLQLPEVGRHDVFLELGGNSLLLLRLHRALCDAGFGQLRPVDLFAWPTVAALAEYYADHGARRAPEAVSDAEERGRRRRRSPLTGGRAPGGHR